MKTHIQVREQNKSKQSQKSFPLNSISVAELRETDHRRTPDKVIMRTKRTRKKAFSTDAQKDSKMIQDIKENHVSQN